MIHTLLLDAASVSSYSFWDTNILDLIDGIKNQLDGALFVQEAKEIAAILSLLYLSVKAYSLMLGEGRFEIMPLFRPFLITLIIVNFGLFSRILSSVGDSTQNTAKIAFEANAEKMDNMLLVKQQKMDSIRTLIERSRSQIQGNLAAANEDKLNKGWLSKIDPTNGIQANLSAWLTVTMDLAWARLSMWMQGIIMWVVIALMKGVMYCLFFMQMIFLHILLIIGPIAFAFSIVGAFGSSWIEWVKHFISVSFWGTIGFIVMNIVCTVIAYGLQQEIYRLTAILKNGKELWGNPGSVAAPSQATALFFASIGHIDNFLGFLLIGLITAIGGIAATPLVASWIIGGATNSAMKSMHTGGSMIAGAAAGAVSGGLTAATGGVGSVASTGISAAKNRGSSSESSSKIVPPPQQPPPSRPS